MRRKKEEEEAMWAEYIEQRKKQRAKEEEELKRLKERQVSFQTFGFKIRSSNEHSYHSTIREKFNQKVL